MALRAGLDRLSVGTRLFLAIFAPSLLLLLVATLAVLVSDVVALRNNLEREATINAALLANAARGAVGLDEPASTKDVLEALLSHPDIRGAAIYRKDGTLFATSPPRPGVKFPAVPQSGRVASSLHATVKILVGDEEIGTVWLEVSLGRYYARLRYYSFAVIATLILLLGGAAALARLLQRQFSHPLEELAGAAQRISGEQNYSIRAPVFKAPEFKVLTEAFNHMLDRIERQNQVLTERTVQLEKANVDLSRTNKELEAFTYTVSHDLRTPLRAISSYSQLLREELGDRLAPEAFELMDRIQKNAIKMAQLIDELLAFSRLDAHPLERAAVDIAEMVRQVWQDLTAQQPDAPITLKIGKIPPANVDPLLFRQVLANLLGNAIKYSRTQTAPSVEVGAFTKEGETIYFAKDNGVGFSMQYVDKLFGIFQRLHSEHEFEGTGVGLAIVHRIITRHGGRVWAAGEPNKGATFFFTVGGQSHAENGHTTR